MLTILFGSYVHFSAYLLTANLMHQTAYERRRTVA